MNFELTDDQSSIENIEFNVARDLALFPKFPVQCVRVTGAFGEILFYEYTYAGISFRYSLYHMKLHSFLKARANLKILELRIALKNQILGIWDGLDSPSLAEGRFSLGFTPHVQTKAEFQEDNSYTTCDFHFECSYLIEMAKDFPILSEFLEQIEQNKAVQVLHPSLICSQSMMEAVRYIQNNPFSEKSQKHIFVNRAKEILLSALEIMSEDPEEKPIILDSRVIEALQHGKDFIERNFDEELSLKLLCKECALSEFTLKKGFKALFQVTPIEYQIRLKMSWAKELILSGEYTITEVAYKLGYHFVSNFTLEFKRRFGYTPSYFKKYGRIK